MNIIADALKDFEISSRLTSGSVPLKCIKINETGPECVTVSQKENSVFFVHGKDRIEVLNAPLDRTINTVLEISRRFEIWEKELHHRIFNGCRLQALVDQAEEVFCNPVFFVDMTDQVLARTEHGEGEVNDAWDYILETGYLPFDSASLSTESMQRNIQASRRGGKNVPFLFSPPTRDIDNRGINYLIFSPETGERVGVLIIIENETPVTLGMLNLSSILAEAVDEWMSMHRFDHPFKTDRDVVKALIEESEQFSNKKVLGRYIAPSPEGYQLAVITGIGHIREQQIQKMIEDTIEGSRAYKFGEETIAVLPRLSSEKEIRDRLDMALYFSGVRIGFSYPFHDFGSLGSSYHQAKVALSFGHGKFSGIGTEIAMRYFTEETSKTVFGADIAHPALDQLKEYDARHGGELYDTLYQFLRKERSLIASARALNIHRNSLIYRVEKIRQLTGLDLEDEDLREYLLFSYRIRKQ